MTTRTPTRETFDADHEAFRDSCRVLLERASGLGPRELFRRLAAGGLLGVRAPEEFGGGGVDDVRFDAVCAQEAMRLGLTGAALSVAMHGAALPLIAAYADGATRRRLLPGLVAGDLIAAMIVSDSGGSVPAVINGAVADVVLVAAAGQLSLLERPSPGATGAGSLHVEGAAAATLDPTGPAVLLGSAEEAEASVALAFAVIAAAGAHRAFDLTRAYVAQRRVFGTPVASFENTRDALTRTYVRCAAADALVGQCLRAPADDADVALLAALDAFTLAADEGLQLHGGYGYMREYPISQSFSDAAYLRLQADERAVVARLSAARTSPR